MQEPADCGTIHVLHCDPARDPIALRLLLAALGPLNILACALREFVWGWGTLWQWQPRLFVYPLLAAHLALPLAVYAYGLAVFEYRVITTRHVSVTLGFVIGAFFTIMHGAAAGAMTVLMPVMSIRLGGHPGTCFAIAGVVRTSGRRVAVLTVMSPEKHVPRTERAAGLLTAAHPHGRIYDLKWGSTHKRRASRCF